MPPPTAGTPTVAQRILYPDAGAAPFIFYGSGEAADYNGDGLVDFADHDYTTGNFWVHLNLNTSPPTWDSNSWGGQTSANGVTAHGEGWDEWTGSFSSTSGRADYVDHWLPSGQFWVHQNYADGGFAPNGVGWGGGFTHATQGSSGDPGWEFLTGDFDGDGATDFVEHYRPTGVFTVYKNFRDGGFGSPLTGTGIIGGGVSAAGPRWSMVVSDFNNDGRADYADVRFDMYRDTPDAGVWIHYGQTDGGFTPAAIVVGPADAGSQQELLAGNWEHHSGTTTKTGQFQYMIHDVPTGALTAIACTTTEVGPPTTWFEIPSASTTKSSSTIWETLGTPHEVWATLTSDLPNGMGYEGGLVEGGKKTLYVMQWGSVPSADATVVEHMLQNINGQTYANIFTLYNDLRGDKIDNSYSYWGSYTVTSPSCSGSWFDGIEQSLTDALDNGNFPVDPTGEYIVLGGTDMQSCTNVCNGQCGFHYAMPYTTSSGRVIQINWLTVPDMYGCASGDCLLQSLGPNGAPGGDSMVYWISHELGEGLTNPSEIGFQDPSWPDSQWTNHYYTDGGVPEAFHEEGDYCQYLNIDTVCTHGDAGVDAYDVTWGSYHFCVQESWLNESGATCGLAP